MRHQIQWILIGIATVGLLGLPVFAQGNGGDTSVTRQPNGGFEARIFTDRTNYGPNRAVEITLTLTNLRNIPAVVAPGRDRPYTYVIRDSRSNRVVYDMARHRPNVPTSFTLPAGENRTSRELWDQRDDAGQPVGRGVYVIEARIWPQSTVSAQIFLADRDGPQRPRPPHPQEPTVPPPTIPNPGNPGNPGALRLRSTLAASIARAMPGQAVTLTYTVINATNGAFSVSFRSGKQFDMIATGPNGSQVWQQSEGMAYTQSLTQLQLPAGGHRQYSATWTVPANAAPGVYRISAYLVPTDSGGKEKILAPAAALVRVGGNGGGEAGNPAVQPLPRPRVVTLRQLLSEGNAAIGQRVTVSGMFGGLSGAAGSTPFAPTEWNLLSDGLSIAVLAPPPGANATPGRNATVTGTVRRKPDGKLRIEAP